MHKALGVLLVVAVPVIFFLLVEGKDPLRIIPGFSEERPLVLFSEQVPLRVEIADTQEERTQGLSGRQSLDPTEGLLFVFDESGYHGIWMKDMLFPIDVLWIDENFRVIHIERNVLPDTYPRVFEPHTPARFIIETNGNYADSFKIRVGDTVQLPKEAVPQDLQR